MDIHDKKKWHLHGKELNIWIVFSIVFFVIWLGVLFFITAKFKSDEREFLNMQLNQFEGEVYSVLHTYKGFSNYIFDEINQDDEILEIMYRATSEEEENKDALRQELFWHLDEKYESIQKYNFRQLHFHLPSTESFLRMHTPDKYGDLLAEVRESVRIVNETQESISGFEEGRVYNGYRYVYPLSYENEHVGSVEVSISSASVLEVLSQLYIEEDFYFIIRNTVVQDKLFDSEIDNYNISKLSDDFLVDQGVEDVITKYNTIFKEFDEGFYEELKKELDKTLDYNIDFSSFYSYQDQHYIIKGIVIRNFKEEPVACILSISETTDSKRMHDEYWMRVILITLIVVFIILFGLMLAFYQHQLKDNSELDYLTKQFNRNKFYSLAYDEIRRAKRYKYEVSVLMMDVDKFKKINDTYGHERGDQVLKAMAKLIREIIRCEDVFARWGGEEFVVLLPHTNIDEATKVAEKIRSVVEQENSHVMEKITISLGVASINHNSYDIDKAISQADEAMYKAKANGRNQVCVAYRKVDEYGAKRIER